MCRWFVVVAMLAQPASATCINFGDDSRVVAYLRYLSCLNDERVTEIEDQEAQIAALRIEVERLSAALWATKVRIDMLEKGN